MRIHGGLTAGALAVALVWVPGRAHSQGLMVTGYADFEAVVSNPFGDGNSEFYFDNHHFNLIMVGKIVENLFAAVEVEYEHAGEEIALEYGYFAYTGIKNFRIMAGKFIVPFGRFNKDLHPTFINKMPDRPHGFANILPQTYNDVGVWVSGGAPFGGNGARFVYDAFVVNGLMGDDGGNIRGMRDNDRESRVTSRDNKKSVGGRLGLEFGPQGLDFGASIYHGNSSNDPALGTLNLTLFGADVAYRNSGFEVRGEVVSANQEATAGDLTKTGGYGQVAYLIGSRVEPVVRYSARAMPGDADDRSRLSFGLNYIVGAASQVRLAYHVNMEKEGFESDNDQLIMQWGIIF